MPLTMHSYIFRSLFLKIFVISTLLFTAVSRLSAQLNPCEQRHASALQLFRSGQLFEAADSLCPCIADRSLSHSLRRNILELAAKNYAFLDSNIEARSTMLELLRLDPFYKADDSIPEMVYLRRQVITSPDQHFTFQVGGFVYTRPIILNPMTWNGARIVSAKYTQLIDDPWGVTASVNAGFALSRSNVDLNVGFGLSRYSFRYTALLDNALNSKTEQRGPATLTYNEKHWWYQIPIFLSYNLTQYDKIVHQRFTPFVSGGLMIDLLQKKSANIENASIYFASDTLTASGLSLSNYRRKVNINVLAGLGVRYHFKELFLQFEAVYTRQLKNLISNNRYQNPTLNYVDNDFVIQNIVLRVGFGYYRFKSVFLRR
jgi:hypothetical protein